MLPFWRARGRKRERAERATWQERSAGQGFSSPAPSISSQPAHLLVVVERQPSGEPISKAAPPALPVPHSRGPARQPPAFPAARPPARPKALLPPLPTPEAEARRASQPDANAGEPRRPEGRRAVRSGARGQSKPVPAKVSSQTSPCLPASQEPTSIIFQTIAARRLLSPSTCSGLSPLRTSTCWKMPNSARS